MRRNSYLDASGQKLDLTARSRDLIFHGFVAAHLAPGLSQSPVQRFGTHCPIRCVILPSSLNWTFHAGLENPSLPNTEDTTALEVPPFHRIALYKPTFTLRNLLTMAVWHWICRICFTANKHSPCMNSLCSRSNSANPRGNRSIRRSEFSAAAAAGWHDVAGTESNPITRLMTDDMVSRLLQAT